MSAPAWLTTHRRGPHGNDPNATETLCRQALASNPDDPFALCALGLALRQQGRYEDASRCFERVTAIRPAEQATLPDGHASPTRRADAWNDLGVSLIIRGDAAGAGLCFRAALGLDATFAPAHNNLGALLRREGNLTEALDHVREAVRLRPAFVEAHNNLGNVLRQLGDVPAAEAAFRDAIARRADYPDSWHGLGLCATDRGDHRRAAECQTVALRARPEDPQVQLALGNALRELGDLPGARAAFERAVTLAPRFAGARLNLGIILGLEGRHDEALASYRQATTLDPSLVEAQVTLAHALRDLGRVDEAAAAYDRALAMRPSPALRILRETLIPPIAASLDDMARSRGRLLEGLDRLEAEGVTQDLAIEPAHPAFYLAYQGLDDRAVQERLARLYRAPGRPREWRKRSDPTDRIRVGFISRHFRNHTIGELFRGTIARLDRSRFHVTTISIGSYGDRIATDIQRHSDVHVTTRETLHDARRVLSGLNLDVLIFTDIGMEELSYSLAFTRWAPAQCVLWGHPVTTGLVTIDHFLSGARLEPESNQAYYSETLVLLRELPVFYRRPALPDVAPGRADFGLPADAHLYGCLQSLFKLHPEFDGWLAQILGRDPKGLLVLVEGRYDEWSETLRVRFRARMPDVADRVVFVPRQGRERFLGLTALCDVHLDPSHFGGGNTSYEALALGVPVVTWPSPFLRGRITRALYDRMEMTDCIAADGAAYVDLAVRLGTDPGFRERVRGRIKDSSDRLFDDLTGIRALESFLIEAVEATTRSTPAGAAR